MQLIASLILGSAHLLAAIADLIGSFVMTGILVFLRWMGPAAWIFSLLLVFLALWSWKRRLAFGAGWTVGAEIFLPFLCGAVYFLIQEQYRRDLFWLYDEDIPPEIWSLFLLLGIWTLYLCLLPLWKDRKSDSSLRDIELAERLLRKGNILAGIVWAWCGVILSGIFLLSTVGILFSMILGGLFAQNNDLWEYDAAGVMVGVGALYLLQLVYLVRAALRLEGVTLEGKQEHAVLWMLVPGLSFLKANSLLAKLETKRIQEQRFTYLK